MMRWPLRNQILFPMVSLMLVSLIGVSVMNAYLSAHRTKRKIERNLHNVALTMADSNFPLTKSVLNQMRGLSGAEFILLNDDGAITSKAIPIDTIKNLPVDQTLMPEHLILSQPIQLNENEYFHTSVRIRYNNNLSRSAILHILYPVQTYRDAWNQAVYPPLLIGVMAILLVVISGLFIASRVTRPLRQLKEKMILLGEGDFRPIAVPKRNDEIADLSYAINRTGKMLTNFENQIRTNERFRMLGQLGGGIAHQIRNSATGCRIALQLHARQCPHGNESEDLTVAVHQLKLMEKYLQKFLSLGRQREEKHQHFDLVNLVDGVVSLISPTAQHLGVDVMWEILKEPVIILGDPVSIEQMLLNLMLNAIEASQQGQTSPNQGVVVSLSKDDHNAVLKVIDNGSGPSSEVKDKIFEPFISEKPDGAGLGLSVVRESVIAHQGNINWHRQRNTTCFTVELPLSN